MQLIVLVKNTLVKKQRVFKSLKKSTRVCLAPSKKMCGFFVQLKYGWTFNCQLLKWLLINYYQQDV